MGKLLTGIIGIGMICAVSIFAQPDPTATAILDDFEDTWGDEANQNNLGAVKGYLEKGEDFVFRGGGWWYAYFDDSGSAVMTGAKDDTIGETNAGDMIEEEKGNRFLHVWCNTDESLMKYPYAGFGCLISGEENGDIHDLSAMTAVKMKIKGDGFVALRVETQDVFQNFDWGYYQTNVDLTSEWTEVSVSVEKLEPPPYSEPEDLGWTWEGGADADNIGGKEATKISFQVKDGDYAEIYIDDITLEGMKYSDFVPIISPAKVPSLTSHNVWVSGNTISYNLQDRQHVRLGVYDLQGKLVNDLVNRKDAAGTHTVKWNGEHTNGADIANGTYIVRFIVGSQSRSIPLAIVK